MSFIGALNFYTKFIEKLHIIRKPFNDLLHENTHGNGETNTKHFSKNLKRLSPLKQN